MGIGELVSLALSVGSALSSAYLWVLEKRRQAPQLSASWSGRNFVWRETWAPEGLGGRLRHLFELEVFVANLSAKPDVLLDLRFRVDSKAGWLAARWDAPVDAKSNYTYLPLNLPPRCTESVFVLLEVETGPEVGEEAIRAHLANPTMRLDVELVGLGDQRHRAVAVCPPPEDG